MADGSILIEVRTQAARDELERLLAENRTLRRSAERCVTAWNVVRGGVWDPNGLMDEHVDALRKALGPNARGNAPDTALQTLTKREEAARRGGSR